MRNTLAMLALCGAGFLVASCEITLFGDECYSDSDCSWGYVCDYRGVHGNICVPSCFRHTDCPRGQYCTSCSAGGCYGEGTCEDGCRSSAECDETTWCDNGACVTGCFGGACSYGRPGSVCVGSSTWDASSECRWSCQVDADCTGTLAGQCTMGVCMDACETDRDCDTGLACRPMSGCSTKVCFRR